MRSAFRTAPAITPTTAFEVKYYDHPESFLDKMAFTLTGDAGCEIGRRRELHHQQEGCCRDNIIAYKQSFLGYMLYNRWWFHKDRLRLHGGWRQDQQSWPLPGACCLRLTARPRPPARLTSPRSPGDPFKAWDISGTYDYMPSQYITFRWEFNHRHANVPYWSGPRWRLRRREETTATRQPSSRAGSRICAIPRTAPPWRSW